MLVDLPTPAATEAFGRRLGSVLAPGNVVALVGPLGAGKTHLVRAVAGGLGVRNLAAVTSPTFGLIHEYPGRCPVYHFDAYRLAGPREFADLGADEYLSGDGVCLIEWADRVVAALPGDFLRLDLMVTGPGSRQVTLTPTGPGAVGLVRRLTGAGDGPLDSSPGNF